MADIVAYGFSGIIAAILVAGLAIIGGILFGAMRK